MERDPTGLATNKKKTQYGELAKQGHGNVAWPLPRAYWREDVEDSYEAFRHDVSSSVARQVDVTMVMRYFDLQEAMARVFDELLMETSFLSTSDNGTQTSHPHLGIFCRLVATSIRLANEIGATPMSRVKLGLYATEGAAAQMALERAVNSDQSVKSAVDGEVIEVEVVGDAVVMRW